MINKLLPVKRRILRNRAQIKRRGAKVRLSVFRSNKYIYAQLIDLKSGKILAAASDVKNKDKKTKTEKAFVVGQEIGASAVKVKVKQAVFDRGAYKYHGRVKAVCEGAREAKLII